MEKATAVPSANASVVQIEIRHAAVARKCLWILENIANPANGVNQRPWCIVVYLAAQAIDMDIHDVGRGINPHPPDMVQDHRTSYHASFIPAEIFQQRKLLWSQLQQVIAPSCLTTHQVKLQVSGLKTHRFILWNPGSAQKISQPRQ